MLSKLVGTNMEILSACSNLSPECNYLRVYESVDFHEIKERLNEKQRNCHMCQRKHVDSTLVIFQTMVDILNALLLICRYSD